MPELPEVEVTRRRIAPLLVGRTIARVATTRPSYLFLTPPGRLRRRLPGRSATAVERAGKYLVVRLDDASRLVLHLGMTGQLFASGTASVRLLRASARGALVPEAQGAFRPDEHTHLRLGFEDGGPEVWLRDSRKFGKVLWLPPGRRSPRLDRLGPDALTLTAAQIFAATRGRRVAIKNLLLDQAVVAGVGNIYADEALFRAGIDPRREGGTLTEDECAGLSAAIADTLADGLRWNGTSLSDMRYLLPDGRAGEFAARLSVYGRDHEPCASCGTPIQRTVIRQRSTHLCPVCQV